VPAEGNELAVTARNGAIVQDNDANAKDTPYPIWVHQGLVGAVPYPARPGIARCLPASSQPPNPTSRIPITSVTIGRYGSTTTVLWLNEFYGLDITCIRLTPYRVDGRLLLDVLQVIPLPEAQELMVRLRQRETAVRAATGSPGGADWTQYVIKTPAGATEPLRKRRAILALVHALHQAGVPAAKIERAIPGPRFLSVDGHLEGEELADAFVDAYPGAYERLRRWFLDEPVQDGETTWVLSKMWGTNTLPTLVALELAPTDGYGYQAMP